MLQVGYPDLQGPDMRLRSIKVTCWTDVANGILELTCTLDLYL